MGAVMAMPQPSWQQGYPKQNGVAGEGTRVVKLTGPPWSVQFKFNRAVSVRPASPRWSGYQCVPTCRRDCFLPASASDASLCANDFLVLAPKPMASLGFLGRGGREQRRVHKSRGCEAIGEIRIAGSRGDGRTRGRACSGMSRTRSFAYEQQCASKCESSRSRENNHQRAL